MEILSGILFESFKLYNEMSLYLIIGFLFAGLLHIFISPERIAAHLGGDDFTSIIKAAAFGVPLPLCSCGVIPAAMSLKKEGASSGATIAFLISTPTTGIDSMFATYSLLGPVFAVYRVLTALIAGIIAGIVANIFMPLKNKAGGSTDNSGAYYKINRQPIDESQCRTCCCKDKTSEREPADRRNSSGLIAGSNGALRYAFIDLLAGIVNWLIIGLIIAGLISYFTPPSLFENYLNSGFKSMLAMLIIGIPLYVCATGSIPIAAALMLKGMTPGAGFVFLFAGPATNAVTIVTIARELGKKGMVIYLSVICITGLIFGFCLDFLWDYLGLSVTSYNMQIHNHSNGLLSFFKYSASVILGIFIIYNLFNNIKSKCKSNK